MTSSWILKHPINTLIFDCDGTLTKLEGIDELAKKNSVSEQVTQLTAKAMGETGLNQSIYEKRLNLVRPSEAQVQALGNDYFTHQVSDVSSVITLLKRLNKTIYIISAGLYPSVQRFGELLQIPDTNIFAVDIQFDSAGNYLTYDRESVLVNNNGKRHLVEQLKQIHTNLIYVGDGLNDYAAYDLATRFIGFGGAFYHQKIADNCQYYIKTPSMTALLPLVLTARELALCTDPERNLYLQGLAAIQSDGVIIR
jgi:phosphoserine phosphatase